MKKLIALIASLLFLLPAAGGCAPDKPEESPGNNLPFDEPLEHAFNYCPSVIQEEDGTRYVYYCANKVSGVIQDHIYCRKGTVNAKGGYSWSEKTLVLAPTFGNFDAFHCCDPTVIEGAFRYRGTDYKYLMAYTGNTSNINNKVGLAFSNDLMSGWVSMDEPFITYDGDKTHWSVGQPALLSVDCQGTVLLLYAVGGTATYMMAETWDLSDMSEPKRLGAAQITHRGLTSLTGGADYLNNADIAFDPATRRYYFVSDCHPYPTDGDPLFVSDSFRVTYLGEAGGIGDLFESALSQAGKSWMNLATVGEAETGFKRNSNCGIVRDSFGYLPNPDEIEILYSMSELGGQYEWTYRIYAHTLSIEE